MKKILLTLFLYGCFVGCEYNPELFVEKERTTSPRNHREKLIFDYFQALQEKKYFQAYHMRIRDTQGGYFQSFRREHEDNHRYLAVAISIGEEELLEGQTYDGFNTYIYIVYADRPHTTTLWSGEVAIYCKSDSPQECLMGYNSAFGVAP